MSGVLGAAGGVLSTVNVALGPAAAALLPAVSVAVPAASEIPRVPSPVMPDSVNVRVAPVARRDVEAFLADAAVADAMRRAHPRASTTELVRLAHGAPGALVGGDERAAAIESAERLLASALSGDRSKTMRAAMAQGTSRARGRFADILDALTELVADRARAAVVNGDDRTALGASRAMATIEQAKTLVPNNVSPALITAVLLRDLSAELS